LGKNKIRLKGRLNFNKKSWRLLKRYCTKRDGGKFCIMKDGNCYGAVHLHHKKPLSEGGTNRPSNLAWICHLHHCVKHPWMIKSIMKKAGY